MSSSKVWFVTGSSRGLGRALAEEVLKAGHRLVATARNPEQLTDLAQIGGDRFRAVRLDVASQDEARAAVGVAVGAFGRIDVVVNNAGYGYTGAFEEQSEEAFRAQIDTNFWGVVHVTRAVLPVLRKQGSGHLIPITSIGGRGAVPGLSGYHAAKFAVEGFSEAVAKEVLPLGIRTTIVEPGGFRTDWAGTSMDYAESMEAYAATVGVVRTMMQGRHVQQGDPRKAAQAILQIAEMAEPPLRLPLGTDALALLRRGYKGCADDLERWAPLIRSTDFDGLNLSDATHPILDVPQVRLMSL
jgi:NAD(P)-dependent dehydrogenase (short-subunit alcohol dehydrogenase family)